VAYRNHWSPRRLTCALLAALVAGGLSLTACDASEREPPSFTGGTSTATGATTTGATSSSSGGATCTEVATAVDTRVTALCDALAPMGACTSIEQCPLSDDEAAFADAVDCLCELEELVTCTEGAGFGCEGDEFDFAAGCSSQELAYLTCSKIPGNSCNQQGSNTSCSVACAGPSWGAACDATGCTCTAGPHMGDAFAGNCGLGWENHAADVCLAQ